MTRRWKADCIKQLRVLVFAVTAVGLFPAAPQRTAGMLCQAAAPVSQEAASAPAPAADRIRDEFFVSRSDGSEQKYALIAPRNDSLASPLTCSSHSTDMVLTAGSSFVRSGRNVRKLAASLPLLECCWSRPTIELPHHGWDLQLRRIFCS